MTRQLEAIYQGGVLRPLQPLDLVEDQRVTVIITSPAPEDKEDPNALNRAIASMINRTPEQIAEAQARAIAEFQPERELPPGQTILDAIYGKWPGTETDEEVSKALERLS